MRNGLQRNQGFNPKTRQAAPNAAGGWDKDPLPYDMKPLFVRPSAIRNARPMKARDLWRRKNYG